MVRDYKSGIITHSECVKYIETAFRPLFVRKQKEMAKISTEHTWIGTFWDAYLQCICDSLKSFSFNHHKGSGPNKLSFTPYFQELFSCRCIEYKKVLCVELEESKKISSLEDLLETSNEPPIPKFQFSISKNSDIFDYIQHHDESYKNEVEFEEYLKKEVLSLYEYKIFYMKMCGRSNAYVGTKMKREVSGETIRKEWDRISMKISEHFSKRRNLI